MTFGTSRRVPMIAPSPRLRGEGSAVLLHKGAGEGDDPQARSLPMVPLTTLVIAEPPSGPLPARGARAQ
jgi:hypothetical protein